MTSLISPYRQCSQVCSLLCRFVLKNHIKSLWINIEETIAVEIGTWRFSSCRIVCLFVGTFISGFSTYKRYREVAYRIV